MTKTTANLTNMEIISIKIKKNSWMPMLTIITIIFAGISKVIKQENKITDIKIEELRLSLFADTVIIY